MRLRVEEGERRWGWATLYICAVVTLTLWVQILGVPFVEGR